MIVDKKNTAFAWLTCSGSWVHEKLLNSISSVLQLQFTRCDCAPLTIPSNIEARTCEGCPMPHQLQSESFRARQSIGKSDSIIANREGKCGGVHRELKGNSLRSSMLDRVRYGFLGDSIEVSRNGGVADG